MENRLSRKSRSLRCKVNQKNVLKRCPAPSLSLRMGQQKAPTRLLCDLVQIIHELQSSSFHCCEKWEVDSTKGFQSCMGSPLVSGKPSGVPAGLWGRKKLSEAPVTGPAPSPTALPLPGKGPRKY